MSEPARVTMTRVDRDLLRVGDRLSYSGRQVEIVEVKRSPGRPNTALRFALAGVKTGRRYERTFDAAARIFTGPVDILVAPDRLTLFDLSYWGGGSGYSRGGLANPEAGQPLDLALTAGGRCFLRPSFSPAGVSTADGGVSTEPAFYKMAVAIPSAGVCGDLALLTATSAKLWGGAQWSQMADRLATLAPFDGGLNAAGQVLHDIGAAGPGTGTYAEAAWYAALETVHGPIDAATRTLVPHLARRWTGNLEQLLLAARMVTTA